MSRCKSRPTDLTTCDAREMCLILSNCKGADAKKFPCDHRLHDAPQYRPWGMPISSAQWPSHSQREAEAGPFPSSAGSSRFERRQGYRIEPKYCGASLHQCTQGERIAGNTESLEVKIANPLLEHMTWCPFTDAGDKLVSIFLNLASRGIRRQIEIKPDQPGDGFLENMR